MESLEKSGQQKQLFTKAVIFFVVVMCIGGAFDLNISNAVANQNSIFGTIFQDYGLFPPALVCMISGQIIIQYGKRMKAGAYVKYSVCIGGFALTGWQLWDYLKNVIYYNLATLSDIKKGLPMGTANSDGGNLKLSWIGNASIWLAIIVIFIILAQLWLNKKTDEELKYLVGVAIVATLAVMLSDTLNSLMKNYWGRVRPYELNKAQTNYTPWFQINGPDGHLSFPSGHSESAALAVLFGIFVSRKNRPLQIKMFYGGVIYAFLMACSRVRIGAHFFADTMAGLFTTFFVIFIVLSVTGKHIVEDDEDNTKVKD
ncbi:MAG: phosphatase PAP2 family protein [Clostridium sp.]|nr:phosphatase PAP2 family protein [Clostridium sp.]